jgi:hypothetical protein
MPDLPPNDPYRRTIANRLISSLPGTQLAACPCLRAIQQRKSAKGRYPMTQMRKLTTATMAAAAMALLAGGAISLTTQPAQADAVKCSGVNSCKGQSACKSASNECKGLNECKGHGWIEQSSAEACTSAGGTVLEG